MKALHTPYYKDLFTPDKVLFLGPNMAARKAFSKGFINLYWKNTKKRQNFLNILLDPRDIYTLDILCVSRYVYKR